MIFIHIYVIRFWELERGKRGKPGNVKTRKLGNQEKPYNQPAAW